MIEGTKKEKVLSITVIILVLIIVFETLFFISEIKTYKENSIEKVVDLSIIREFELQNLKDGKSNVTMGDILDSEKNVLVYFARPTCSHCVAQTPIMEELAKKHKANIYYLNIDNLSRESWEQLYEIDNEFFGSLGTPTIAIFKDGKITDSIVGESDSKSVLQFMKKYSITK